MRNFLGFLYFLQSETVSCTKGRIIKEKKKKIFKSHHSQTSLNSWKSNTHGAQLCLWTASAYPFGGWYPQAVLFGVEAADSADLSDEVNVFLILRLLTLASLVFSIEVKETAGQHEVPAGVRRSAVREKNKKGK